MSAARATPGGWRWRPMAAADLPGVLALAEAVHPDYPEDAAVFAERLRLFPEGCLTLETQAGLAGYLVAHPWTAGRPPALNSLLGALPARPQLYYLHDLALAPAARGSGAAPAAVALAAQTAARLGLGRMALVAVGGADGFWRRCGFAPAAEPALQEAARRYDPHALYMTRETVAAAAK
ncbi:GNAT family N-acetyltransferase [Camelimonas abortus]|uniref:GNAT family N-acetyltransferase n=1 Tax=Camelimonas abortus TaxID=1017184 RepID=A0ABV7LF05_9HYPH